MFSVSSYVAFGCLIAFAMLRGIFVLPFWICSRCFRVRSCSVTGVGRWCEYRVSHLFAVSLSELPDLLSFPLLGFVVSRLMYRSHSYVVLFSPGLLLSAVIDVFRLLVLPACVLLVRL